MVRFNQVKIFSEPVSSPELLELFCNTLLSLYARVCVDFDEEVMSLYIGFQWRVQDLAGGGGGAAGMGWG